MAENDIPDYKVALFQMLSYREQPHLDYKRELFCKFKSESESETSKSKESTIGYIHILKDIMAMYNTPAKYGMRFKSISGKTVSSFIIFGIDFKEGRLPSEFLACPIDRTNIKRGFIDERTLGDLIRERLTYPINVSYIEVYINENDFENELLSSLTWFKNAGPGCYGLLEIQHDDTRGPVMARAVKDGTATKVRNEIANKLFFRNQTATMGLDRTRANDDLLALDVYRMFTPSELKYANRFDDVKKIAKPKKSFQILIATPILASKNEQIQEVLTSLSNVAWNVVFDTDQRTSEQGGLRYFFADKLVYPTQNLVANEIGASQDHGFKNLDLGEVAHKQTCLYVFTNGDSTAQVKEPNRFPRTDLQTLTKAVFEKIDQPIALIVYVMVCDPSVAKIVAELCTLVETAWEDEKAPEDSDDATTKNCQFVFVSHHESLLTHLNGYLPTLDNFFSVVAPFPQITSFFEHLQRNGSGGTMKVEIPASSGKVVLAEKEMKIMSKYFNIYYNNKGAVEWANITNDQREEYKETVAKKFLQGFHLEPEALYLDERGLQKIFVQRDIMRECTKTVRQTLTKLQVSDNEKTPLHRVEQNIVQLIHEPSAGGTTVGRVVLWKIRDEFPCLILLTLEESNYQNIIEWLYYLYDRCRLPICILIDTSVITNIRFRDVERFASAIQVIKEIETKIVVFFVQQIDLINENENQLILPNKLSAEETSQFNDLMSEASSMLEKTPFKSIGLYGLCQFGPKYKRFEESLKEVKRIGGNRDKMLMLLSAIVFSYSKQPLPFYFVAKILNEDPELFYQDLERMLEKVHMARDFLLVEDESSEVSDNFHKGIRPVTSFVSNKILSIVFGEKEDYLRLFINSVLNLIEHSRLCVQAVSAISKPLLTQRHVTFEGMKQKFSQFVNDLDETYGAEMTALELEKIVTSMGYQMTEEGPHVRAMFARYLAYRLNDIDRALAQMRTALVLHSTQPFHTTKSNDSTLLTTAGHLMTLKLERMSHTVRTQNEISDQLKILFLDAQKILQRAQKNQYNSYSFVIEARLLYAYMYLHFHVLCRKNVRHFMKLVEDSNDEILKEAAEEAMKKLSLLECLLQKHDMDGYDDTTEKYVSELRMKILSLKIDVDNTDPKKYLRMCKDDPWLVRGLVDFFFFNMQQKSKTLVKPTFEMLEPDALKSMVELFSEHITQGLTSANFRHAILAIIYLYQLPVSFHYGNLLMAQNFAQRWFKNYKDDNRPYYFIALFYLQQALALDKDSSPNWAQMKKEYLEKMKQNYQLCLNLLIQKNVTNQERASWKRHPHEISFVLGKAKTISSLIPKDTNLERMHGSFRLFTGKAKSTQKGHIMFCEEIQSEVTIPPEQYSKWRKYSKDRPQYWFHIQTRTSGFYTEAVFQTNTLANNVNPEEDY